MLTFAWAVGLFDEVPTGVVGAAWAVGHYLAAACFLRNGCKPLAYCTVGSDLGVGGRASKPSHFGLSQNGPDMDPFPTFPRRVFIFLRRRLCVSDLSVVAACASNLSTSVRDK